MSDPLQEPGSTSAQAGETQVVDAAPVAAPVAEVKTDAVEYTFEMPEGVEADASRLEAFTAIAKEAKLPADVAQKVVGMEAARIQAEAKAHVDMVKGWAESVTADPVLGVPENQGIAKSVIDKYGSPELKAYLNDTGLGNHPEFVKLAYSIGKAMSVDGFVTGAEKPPEVTLAKKMFPTMN